MTGLHHAKGIFVASIILLFSVEGLAQQLSLSGTVRDADGVVPDATVTLREAGVAPRMVTTDGKGSYLFNSLGPGYYEVSFSRDGFDTVTRTLTLTPNSTDPLDVMFRVGAVSTSITVTDVGGKGTASRLDIPDRDLPVLVNPIPRELLEQQGVNDMTQALRNASGVQAQRFYGVYEQYTIRGFNASDVMLVDGMRTEAILNRFNTQLNNVDRIEVLKGPSSVLYGGDAVRSMCSERSPRERLLTTSCTRVGDSIPTRSPEASQAPWQDIPGSIVWMPARTTPEGGEVRGQIDSTSHRRLHGLYRIAHA